MPNKMKLTKSEQNEVQRRMAAAKARARKIAARMSDQEDARLRRAAESDPESPPLAKNARLRPLYEVHPQLVAEQLRRGRGRPKIERPKKQVTLRLDQDVLDELRASGDGWQTRVNGVLRAWLGRKKPISAPERQARRR